MDNLASARFGDGSDWPAVRSAIPGDLNAPAAQDAQCAEPALSASSPRPTHNPCADNVTSVSVVPGVPGSLDCKEPADTVAADLSDLGKAGLKIAQARQKVLDILRSSNACTEWFATKDASPVATFQSLSFRLDKGGPYDILESVLPESVHMWRQPYVARATQDGGEHTAITININGAFYRPQGMVLKAAPEGGPPHTDGVHFLVVGSYIGDTLPARMVTLLHEFGHVIDLLPEDADNLDGKSVSNTNEVLRHCRPEIEARSRQAKQTAQR